MSGTETLTEDRSVAETGGLNEVDWIGVDWGTTRLRAWAMDADGQVVVHRRSDQGMGLLEPAGFEPVLLALIEDFLPKGRTTPIIVCGMAGSKQGWIDAGYATVPCAPTGNEDAIEPVSRDRRISVRILPGVRQLSPSDVMRGEETQIAGFLLYQPDYAGVICLPGTHTKWARVLNGQITGFATFLTGEMFAFLSGQSILRHSIATSGWNDLTFRRTILECVADPASVPGQLFRLRADSLISSLDPQIARARLSGLLIGQELAAAHDNWRDGAVTIIGDEDIAEIYSSALVALGIEPVVAAAEEMTRSGLAAACSLFRSKYHEP